LVELTGVGISQLEFCRRLVLSEVLDLVAPIRQQNGFRSKRQAKARTDKGTPTAAAVRCCVSDTSARKGIESGVHLGKLRWVVERILLWLTQFRRLTILCERRQDIHEAFCSLACFKPLSQF
jgi:hypothetical protein